MPRCKNCKEKFDAKHFNQKYCFRSACVKVWVETAKVKNWKKTKKEWKQKNESISSLMKKAQKVFNAYIRKRDKGKGRCHDFGSKSTKHPDRAHARRTTHASTNDTKGNISWLDSPPTSDRLINLMISAFSFG